MQVARTLSIPGSHGQPIPYASEDRPTYMAMAMTLAEEFEGLRRQVYWNGEDHPVIGVGFKLDGSKKVRNRLASYGLNYDSITSGRDVRPQVIMDIFEKDMQSAVAKAVKWLKNFHKLEDGRKAAIAYICFKYDLKGMGKIADMIDEGEDWDKVASRFEKKGVRPEVCEILRKGEIKEIAKDSS